MQGVQGDVASPDEMSGAARSALQSLRNQRLQKQTPALIRDPSPDGSEPAPMQDTLDADSMTKPQQQGRQERHQTSETHDALPADALIQSAAHNRLQADNYTAGAPVHDTLPSEFFTKPAHSQGDVAAAAGLANAPLQDTLQDSLAPEQAGGAADMLLDQAASSDSTNLSQAAPLQDTMLDGVEQEAEDSLLTHVPSTRHAQAEAAPLTATLEESKAAWDGVDVEDQLLMQALTDVDDESLAMAGADKVADEDSALLQQLLLDAPEH